MPRKDRGVAVTWIGPVSAERARVYEIRPDETDKDGLPDEVLAYNPELVHFERMDRDALWCGISLSDGRDLHVNIWVEVPKGRKRPVLKYRAELD